MDVCETITVILAFAFTSFFKKCNTFLLFSTKTMLKKTTNIWLLGSDDGYLFAPALTGRDLNLTTAWTHNFWVAMLWCVSEVTDLLDLGTRDTEVKDVKEIITLNIVTDPHAALNSLRRVSDTECNRKPNSSTGNRKCWKKVIYLFIYFILFFFPSTVKKNP